MAAEKPTTLASAMAAAFAEIEGATKDKVNPHFKSKYADLGSVMDAIKPALVKQGLYYLQHSQPSEDGVIVQTVLYHAGGDKLDLGSLYVPANKRDAQGFGSALTYARRYALMTAFGVPAEDDDGNAASRSSQVANDQRNGAPANGRDDPFPQGPAKNKTELKAMGRDFWREVEGCGDPDELSALLRTNTALTTQLVKALPTWWEGGKADSGEPFEGLCDVITKKQGELALAAANAG